MKHILFVSLLFSGIAQFAQFAQPNVNEVYRYINTSLLCKNLGLVDDAFTNNEKSLKIANNIAANNNELIAKTYTCKGLIYEDLQFSHTASKDAFNTAIKEYSKDINTPYSFDAEVALTALHKFNANSGDINFICDNTADLNTAEPELVTNIPEASSTGNDFLLKGETNKTNATFNKTALNKIDSLACAGNTHLNNLEFDAAEKCFKAYLNLNYDKASKVERKNKNAVIAAIHSLYVSKYEINDVFEILKNTYKKTGETDINLNDILKDDNLSQSYITSLYLIKENIANTDDKDKLQQHINNCIQLQNINAEALARLYILNGILAKEKNDIENLIINFKKAKDLFVLNKVNTIERIYLRDALNYYYKQTGKLKKVITKDLNIATGEKTDHISYTGVANRFDNEEVYAGVEIGSSGIKMTIISVVKLENPERYEYEEVVPPKSNELNVSAFEGQSNRLVLQYVKEFVDVIIKDYKIPKERILIAFSSGVNDAAQTKNKVKDLEQIRDYIEEEVGIEPEILTISQEAKYTHLGVLPSSRRLDITSIDVGGQNTKGGYFFGGKTNYKWGAFTFEYGTKSLLEKASDFGRIKFDNLTACQQKCEEIMESQSQYLYEEISDIMREDERVLFSGGIAWVIGRTMRPEKVNRPDFIDDITLSDVRMFKNEVIKKGLTGFMDQQLRTVTNLSAVEKQKLVEIYEDIKSKKFTDERCISGAVIVENLIKKLDNNRKVPHNYSFGVHTIVGWITGKVVACSEGNCR